MSSTRNIVLRFLTSGDNSVSATLDKINGKTDKLQGDTVNIKIAADSKDAIGEMDKVLRKAQETGATKATIKILCDASEAEAKEAEIRALTDSLGLKKTTIKVNVDANTGKAALTLAAFTTELAATNHEANNTPGLLSKIGSSGSKAADSLGQMIPVLGSIAPESGVGGLFAIPVAVVAIGAAVTEATGLLAGFAAAGTGLGAFAALAYPTIHKISTAYSSINTDQTAYNDALTKTAKNTALDHLKQAYASLDPGERSAVGGIQTLASTYDKMSKAFEPDVFKVFTTFLGVANNLLPDITPFADTFATAIGKIGTNLSNFTASGPFKTWLAQFQKLEGPSIGAIGNGIGKVAVAFGKLLTVLPPKDVVNAINIGFTILAGVINGLAGIVKASMYAWDNWSVHVIQAKNFAVSAGRDIASVWKTVTTNIENWINNAGRAIQNAFSAAWNFIRPIILKLVDTVLGVFGDIIHGAADAFGWVPGVGGKLRGAATQFDKFRDNVNNSLNGINNRSVSVKVDFAPTPSGQEGASKFTHLAASGGAIHGPGGPKADKIPAMLSNGEYVHQASSVAKYGVGAMDAVNQGRAVIQYASGGRVKSSGHADAHKLHLEHKAHLAHLHHEHEEHLSHLRHIHAKPVHHAAAVHHKAVPKAVHHAAAVHHKATPSAHKLHLEHEAHLAHLHHEHAEHTAHLSHIGRHANGGIVGFANGGGVNVNTSFPSASSMNSSISSVVQSLANSNAKSLFSSVSSTGGSGGGAEQWASLVLRVLAMYGLSASWLPNVLRQINTESGGNPNAINLSDSNAKAGYPSQGLMQTIPQTFAAYAGPFASMGIDNPFANIYAAIGYTLSRYGSLGVLGNGHGYANGTNSARSGWAMVGENGPEAVNFRGGESVTPNSKLGGNNYAITVNVPPTANPAEVGRQVVNAIKVFERGSGKSWRN